jgi:hypothetical protein
MLHRYRAALALTLAALAAAAPALPARLHHRHKTPSHTHIATAPLPRIDEIYSRTALRRARILLQLKLLELRSEHLERVRKAIEERLPVDDILKSPP